MDVAMTQLKVFLLASLLAAGVASLVMHGVAILLPIARAGSLLPLAVEAVTAVLSGTLAVWRSRDHSNA